MNDDDWILFYCENIRIMAEFDIDEAYNFSMDYCDKYNCASCPFHFNKLKVKRKEPDEQAGAP